MGSAAIGLTLLCSLPFSGFIVCYVWMKYGSPVRVSFGFQRPDDAEETE
jgi:hypothetical protein